LEDVEKDLMDADLVSLKVDAVSEELWRKINRPHKSLSLSKILGGVSNFTREFNHKIITETMLVEGIKYAGEFEKIAEFLKELRSLDKAYIAIPTRPPAEEWVKPATEETLNRAFQTFTEKLGVDRVEYLIGYEGNAFAFTGNVEEDLLSITAVHPMRKEAVTEFLKKANADWKRVEKLLSENKLVELEYEGNKYYMRRLPSRRKSK
ncbi:radical SAM protein, partial [Candidatus Bathyarchaeota archaeon]